MTFSHRVSRGLKFTTVTVFAALTYLPPAALKAQSSLQLPEDHIPQVARMIDQALEMSPRMVVRQANMAATAEDYKAAKAMRLPNLGGWANYLYSEDDRNQIGGARPAEKIGYNFQIRQPLYHWGNISRSIDNARTFTMIEEGNTRQAYVTLANEIRQGYMSLVIYRQRLALHRFEYEISLNDLAQAEEKSAANEISEADLFQQQLATQRAEWSVLESTNYFENSARSLSRLTGLPILTEDQVPTEFPAPPIEDMEETLVALATRFLASEYPENTAIQITKQLMENHQNDLKNTRTSLRPRFDLVAGISQDEQDFALQTDDYQYRSIFGGITLNWTVFDGFATKARIRSTLARIRASEAELALQEQRLIDDVQAAGREVELGALSMTINEKELTSARNHLRSTEQRAERGEASISDVNWAKRNLQNRLGTSLFSRAEYWNKVTYLLSLIEADPILNRVPVTVE